MHARPARTFGAPLPSPGNARPCASCPLLNWCTACCVPSSPAAGGCGWCPAEGCKHGSIHDPGPSQRPRPAADSRPPPADTTTSSAAWRRASSVQLWGLPGSGCHFAGGPQPLSRTPKATHLHRAPPCHVQPRSRVSGEAWGHTAGPPAQIAVCCSCPLLLSCPPGLTPQASPNGPTLRARKAWAVGVHCTPMNGP